MGPSRWDVCVCEGEKVCYLCEQTETKLGTSHLIKYLVKKCGLSNKFETLIFFATCAIN